MTVAIYIDTAMEKLASDLDASISTLEKLASDLDPEVRNAVAQHPKTTAETLVALGRDADPQVLLSVVQHPLAGRELLLSLSYFDQEIAIRQIARQRLVPLLKEEIREDVLERWESQ